MASDAIGPSMKALAGQMDVMCPSNCLLDTVLTP